MKYFLFCLATFFVSMLCAQTELQKLEQHQNDVIIYSKKQAAFEGQVPEASTSLIYIEPSISSEDAKLIEEKIINYKKNSGKIVLNTTNELNEVSVPEKSPKIPLSEFNSFPLNVQKYIVSKRDFYESYIKFD